MGDFYWGSKYKGEKAESMSIESSMYNIFQLLFLR